MIAVVVAGEAVDGVAFNEVVVSVGTLIEVVDSLLVVDSIGFKQANTSSCTLIGFEESVGENLMTTVKASGPSGLVIMLTVTSSTFSNTGNSSLSTGANEPSSVKVTVTNGFSLPTTGTFDTHGSTSVGLRFSFSLSLGEVSMR
ncbi:hypothetical protein EB796_009845 [Bugula neritina]|uniref:Uncharacterized protein n=1 Tax=Bugula neritina TaxID=10212 RepID=A0A7J7JZK9_BUGNE|nr:hypothetical protein EB796_009845 [Bugula neritina]